MTTLVAIIGILSFFFQPPENGLIITDEFIKVTITNEMTEQDLDRLQLEVKELADIDMYSHKVITNKKGKLKSLCINVAVDHNTAGSSCGTLTKANALGFVLKKDGGFSIGMQRMK